MKILLIASLLALASCLQQETISTGETTETVVTNDNNGSTGNNGTTGTTGNTTSTTGNTTGSTTGNTTGNTGNTGNTPGNGATCFGSTQDGQGTGFPLREVEMIMAGGQSWRAGISGNSGVYGDFYNEVQMGLLLASDSKLRVRFKVKPQPIANAGQEYCHGRSTGQSGDRYQYTKLKFSVHLRDVICSSFNSNGQCQSAYLGGRYASRIVDAADVNSCTPIMDLGHLRNTGNNIIATSIEVDDVRSNSTCLLNGSTNCNFADKVRDASCWNVRMQVATDFTQEFK